MGFERGLERSFNTIKITQEDKDNTAKLERSIYFAARLTCRPSRIRWQQQFALLAKDLKYDRQRIKLVLNWYCKNIQAVTFKIFSASSFRKNFMLLENIMAKSKSDEPIKISKAAKRLCQNIDHYIWPGDFKTQKLPGCIQLSLDNWVDFRTKLPTLHYVDKPLAKFLLSHWSPIPTTEHFMLLWFEEAHDRISDWDTWSQKPSSIMFRVDSKQFRPIFLDWCNSFTLDYKRGMNLLEALKQNE